MEENQQYGLAEDKKTPRRAWWILPVMALNGLVSCWLTTQIIAAEYGYHPSLDGVWFGRLYAPWMWWSWSNRLPDSWGIMERALSIGQFSFMLPQIGILLAAVAFARKPRGRKDLHGSARWATEEDIRKTGLLNGKGVYVGGRQQGDTLHYLRHDGPEHILCFAPTRSGKGVSLVLPTLLSWPESTLILDIKGENWALTSGW